MLPSNSPYRCEDYGLRRCLEQHFLPERLLRSHADFLSVLSSILKCTASVLQPCVALLISHNFFFAAGDRSFTERFTGAR